MRIYYRIPMGTPTHAFNKPNFLTTVVVIVVVYYDCCCCHRCCYCCCCHWKKRPSLPRHSLPWQSFADVRGYQTAATLGFQQGKQVSLDAIMFNDRTYLACIVSPCWVHDHSTYEVTYRLHRVTITKASPTVARWP